MVGHIEICCIFAAFFISVPAIESIAILGGLVAQRHFCIISNRIDITVLLTVDLVRHGVLRQCHLTGGDGEGYLTAFDLQRGLAVQGNIAVRISRSFLGIDGDGVFHRIGVNGRAVFILFSCCNREFPLICTVGFSSETIGGVAVLKRHTVWQTVGHGAAAQAGGNVLRNILESVV